MNYTMLSTDAGAPVLTGENGALANLLTKCIGPDGYGSVNVSSITRSSSTVTVTTSSAHGLQDHATVRLAGADQADYNGKWRVATVPSSTTFTFNIGVLTPVTPATGTITVKRGTPDWTVAFTATNKVALRMPAGSNQHYLDVDDNAVDSAKSALVRGYRAMTAIGTGTEPFPTVAQSANCYWRKSSTASNVVRAWAVIADDYSFWLLVFWHASQSDGMEIFGFGQDVAWNAGDVYNTRITYATAAAASVDGPHRTNGSPVYPRVSAQTAGQHLAADIAGTPGSATGAHYDCAMSSSFNAEARTNAAVPGLITGDQIISPLYSVTPDSAVTKQVRGVVPGIFAGLYAQDTLTNFSIKSDFVEYPGRRFMGIRGGSNNAAVARNPWYFDIDGPWR